MPLNVPEATITRRTTPVTPREATANRVAQLEATASDPVYIRDMLKMEEGIRSRVYIDTKWSKRPTIGVGFNMNRKSARRKFKEINADYDEVRRKGKRLTSDQIEHLFELSLLDAYNDVKSAVSNFETLSVSRQAALVDMAFNLGRKKFLGFTNMLKGVNRGDFEFAAKHIMKSDYASQLPARAARNFNRMLMPLSEFVPPQKGRAK